MPYAADVAESKIEAATGRAIIEALQAATRTTCVFAVKDPLGSNLFDFFAEEKCRPASRGTILARHGVDIDDPLRSRLWAAAWRDRRGVLHVAGTSEAAKRILRSQFDLMATL